MLSFFLLSNLLLQILFSIKQKLNYSKRRNTFIKINKQTKNFKYIDLHNLKLE